MLLVSFSTELNFQINKTNLIYFRCDGKILQMSTFSSLIRHFRPIVPIVAFNIMPQVFSCKMFNYSMSDTLSAILSKTYDEQYGGNGKFIMI